MITLLLIFLVLILAVGLVFTIVGAIAISPAVILVALLVLADVGIIKWIFKKKDKK